MADPYPHTPVTLNTLDTKVVEYEVTTLITKNCDILVDMVATSWPFSALKVKSDPV